MSTAIVTHNLAKSFGSRTVLADIDLDIKAGTIFGFLGPNGAGKTTTVRLLNGLLKPTAGVIHVLGKEVPTCIDEIRHLCGVQTDTSLYESLTAEQNLQLWGQLYDQKGEPLPSQRLRESGAVRWYGRSSAASMTSPSASGFSASSKKLATRVDELLQQFRLVDRRSSRVAEFSKGMKQKLLIARAILHEPQILYLDEPTAGLDPEAADEVISFLGDYVKQAEHTVFLCSHRLEEVETLCDQIAIINHGRILAQGEPADLLHEHFPIREIKITLDKAPKSTVELVRRFATVVNHGLNTIIFSYQEAAVIPQVVAALVQAGRKVFGVTEQPITLQDLYLKLIKQS